MVSNTLIKKQAYKYADYGAIRLVRENGLPDNMIHEKSVQAIQTEPLNLEKNVSPTTIGLEVAKSIHRGLNNVSNY